MRPEVTSASQKSEVESQESEVENQKEESPDIEMTEDEKLVLNLLKENSPLDLDSLKGQTGLSNKKWDKAIKGLTKNKLARVEKTDEGLLVELM